MAKHKGVETVLNREKISEAVKKQIEEAAYFRWMSRRCPSGEDVDDWIEAEHEILDSLKAKHS